MSPKALLSIVGPTATGKTSFAFHLANSLKNDYRGFDLISADSRQVYRGMEIGTGASDNSQSSDDSVSVYGVSIISPDAEWSVAHFQQYALPIIRRSWQNSRLPIVVGGTGLYHRRLLIADDQLYVPPNIVVRQRAAELTLEELQKWLREKAPNRWQQMNDSDRDNPRRLVRAIEIALHDSSATSPVAIEETARELAATKERLSEEEMIAKKRAVTEDDEITTCRQIKIGLFDTLANIRTKISRRVDERLSQGMVEEVSQLQQKFSDWLLPAFSATGYQLMRQWLAGEIDEPAMKELWRTSEFQYAKRQLTWWRKEPDVEWHDVGATDWEQKATAEVKRLLSANQM